jgi:hypothetical protein
MSFGTGILFFLGLLVPLSHADSAVTVVQNGEAVAEIAVPDNASDRLKKAVRTLIAYVKESSGAELPVKPYDPKVIPGGARVIRVDVMDKEAAAGMDADGFVIQATKEQGVTILGATDWGAAFGVYEFLERYVGVRWLMPGPDGDDVPMHKNIQVPFETVRQEPSFFSREVFGGSDEAQATWYQRMRIHSRIKFHHNLRLLFLPSKYTKTHPEFFPIIKGQRYLPPTDATYAWGPCFSNQETVDEAIRNISKYFDDNPMETSYSLGVNDGAGYCECKNCSDGEPKEKNKNNMRNISNLYYAWCNKVVEGVLKKHPDKWFGCLAYGYVAAPPTTVKLNPRIVPFLTYDRMMWVDPNKCAEGYATTESWLKVSQGIGFYDYIYGWPYLVPRVYFHQMADYYRYANRMGVSSMYAEVCPNFGEGPKLYLALRLQWNIKLDVDELLNDWYVRAVGAAAAPDLAKYYAHWEDFWTKRAPKGAWFRGVREGNAAQWLGFDDPRYLEEVTEEDMIKSRAWLEAVVRKADTPKQKTRAGLLLKAFEYYEASVVPYLADMNTSTVIVRNETEALRALDMGELYKGMSSKRWDLLKQSAGNPVLDHDRRLGFAKGSFPALWGTYWGSEIMWKALDWVKKSDAVHKRLQNMAGAESPSGVRQTAKDMLFALDEYEGRRVEVSKNPSFETGDVWHISWLRDNVGSMKMVKEAARSGERGLLCKGVMFGGPFQAVPVKPGHYVGIVYIRVPKQPKGHAIIDLSIAPRNAKARPFTTFPGNSKTIYADQCDWRPLVLQVDVSEETVRKNEVTEILFHMQLRGFEPDDVVYIDDATLYRMSDKTETEIKVGPASAGK